MRKIIIIFIFFIAFLMIILIFFKRETLIEVEEKIFINQSMNSPIALTGEQKTVFPITEFEKRITKKPFGIYITPQNSPVQPERFSGYHTGVDIEHEDVVGEVPVYAIYECQVVLTRWVSGYGGTIVLKCNIKNEEVYVLYSHLNDKSFTNNTQVKKGEQIAILGKGDSKETDLERKHLHFAIRKNNIDLRGYVQQKEELKNWYDPVEFLRNIN